MKTYKEIINLVLTGLIKNNSVCNAENDSLTCLYRSEDGKNACIVGRLIEDEHYIAECEEAGIEFMSPYNATKKASLKAHHLAKSLHLSGIDTNDTRIIRFLDNLQKFHDEQAENGSPIIEDVRDIEWLYDECISLGGNTNFNRHHFDTLWERVTGTTMDKDNSYSTRTNLV